jgi:general secretion pathway protein K
MTRSARFQRRRARGAAILLAMLVLTLVATLAAAMVWQQHRAIQIEAAERSRAQSAWILSAALDWARLILREDARSGGADHLGEPWAVPLAEARLSTFLAADKANSAEASLQAFLSGSIEDAQARYNLRNLVVEGKLVPAELQSLQRVFAAAGLGAAQADRLANALLTAWVTSDAQAAEAAIPPTRLSDLVWLGLDEASVAALDGWVELLPRPTPLNLNTASANLIAAVLGLDSGSAQRLVAKRERKPFENLEAVRPELPPGFELGNRGAVASGYFIVRGELRLDDSRSWSADRAIAEAKCWCCAAKGLRLRGLPAPADAGRGRILRRCTNYPL